MAQRYIIAHGVDIDDAKECAFLCAKITVDMLGECVLADDECEAYVFELNENAPDVITFCGEVVYPDVWDDGGKVYCL